jgi:hypothetical protein
MDHTRKFQARKLQNVRGGAYVRLLVTGLVENVVENVLVEVLADPQEEEATIIQQVHAIAAH